MVARASVEPLSAVDIRSLYGQVRSNQPLKISFCQGFLRCLVKKKRQSRLQEKVAARFEASLDIRNLVSVHSSLSTLLCLLLKKEQLLLFQNQAAHFVQRKPQELINQEGHDSVIVKATHDQHGLARLGAE